MGPGASRFYTVKTFGITQDTAIYREYHNVSIQNPVPLRSELCVMFMRESNLMPTPRHHDH